MSYPDLKLGGVVIEGDLLVDFFDVLSRKLSQIEIHRVLRKIVNGDIYPRDLLSGMASKQELEQTKKELDSLKQANGALSRTLDVERRRANESYKARRKAEREAYEYFEAVRYYEDYLAGIKMRKEILDRTKFSEIFSEEEDEGWTT